MIISFTSSNRRGNLNDAKQISIGVFQNNEVIVRLVSPGITGRPNPHYWSVPVISLPIDAGVVSLVCDAIIECPN
jgi:hypothetical protein